MRKKNEIIFYAVWLIVLAILQPTVMQWIGIFGISPNVYLVFIVATAFLRGKEEGAVCGAIFGLMYDFAVGRIIGISGIVFMYIGFAAGYAEERFLSNSGAIASAIVSFAMALFYGIIYYIAYATAWGDIGFFRAVFRIVFLESIYTALLSLALFLPIRKSFSIIPRRIMY
ncbi:MAG: rod shape-determining protein MreD [Clostridia bacterium]|nr:rod shape-determining protein MreD [Clostridia bacterium]